MAQSLAERYREHRLIFEAALRLGVTPNEARARLRWEQTERKLGARAMAAPEGRATRQASISAPAPDPDADTARFWWQRGGMA